MKIQRLIFFLVLGLLIGFLVGNIKANYKNSDKELVALENMLKAEGQTPDEIKNTLDYMDAQKKSRLRDQIFPIVLGVLLGAMLSFVATELSASRERKLRAVEKKNEITCAIINDTVKFLFKANDILNDLWSDKEVYLRMQKEKPEEASKSGVTMFKRFDENMRKGLFSELNFYSFRLRILDDQTLWDDFEKLMMSFRDLSECLLKSKGVDEFKKFDADYKNLKKAFVEKCITTSRA